MTIEASIPKVTAPFTADQVASLNAYQMCGFLHEFTCGNPDCPAEQAILIATEQGREMTGRYWTPIAGAAMAAVWLGLLSVIGVMTHARWTEYVTVYGWSGALSVMLGWLMQYSGRHRAVSPGRVRAFALRRRDASRDRRHPCGV